MGLTLLTERHAEQIAGVLSCYDRLIVQGTLPVFCYAEGMTAYLSKRRIRIFDFTQFAKPLTDAIKFNAEQVAATNGLTIDYVRKKNFRKEDKVKAVLKDRGSHPGILPYPEANRGNLSLESGRSRICHRHRLSSAGRPAGHLRQPDSDSDPHGQARRYRHLFGQKAERQLPG